MKQRISGEWDSALQVLLMQARCLDSSMALSRSCDGWKKSSHVSETTPTTPQQNLQKRREHSPSIVKIT